MKLKDRPGFIDGTRLNDFGVAIGSIALAILVRLPLQPALGDRAPFAFLFVAVLVTAWRGGLGPALLATALGAAASLALYLPYSFPFEIRGEHYGAALGIYLIVGSGIAWLGGKMRAAKAGADQLAAEFRRQSNQIATTLRSIGDGVIVTDAAGLIVTMNPIAEELTGWKSEAAKGLPLTTVFVIVNEQTRNPVENPASKALREGRIVGLANHTILIAGDGKERPIDDSAAPIYDGDGQLSGVVLVFRDVTERRLAENDQRRLAAIVEFSDDAIISKDMSGHILSWNAGAERVYGYQADEIIGKPFSVLVPQERIKQVQETVRVLESGQPLDHYETVRRRKDGRLIDVSVSYSPIREDDGRVIATAVITRDITDSKRAERELREREQQLRLVTDMAPILIVHGDREQRYRLVNKPYAARFGRKPEELQGRSIGEFLGPPAYAVIRPHLEQVLRGERVQFEADIPYDKIGTKHVLCRYEPELDDSGAVVGFVAAIIDVTETRQMERQLLEEARRTKALYRIGRLLAAELDLAKIVQTVTDETTALTGAAFGAFFYNVSNDSDESYALYALSGAPRENFETFPMPRNTAIFTPTFSGQGPVRFDDVTADPRFGKNAPHNGLPEGHLPVRSYLAVPVVARSGEVLGGLFFGHPDVGVFQQRQEDLVVGVAGQAAVAIENARLYEEIRDADRRKDEFLSLLAHELRNPLAPIRTGLELLQLTEGVAERTDGALDMMERQVQHLVRLVDDLLDVSRIMRGKIELRRETVDLSTVLQRAVETSRPVIDADGHNLTVNLPAEPLLVHGDTVRLSQVISNLLNNAARYTDRGGQIWLKGERDGDQAVVRVRDSGIGIPADMLTKIWELFFQADRTMRSAQGGMGIGLTLVRRLVDLHEGSVFVFSDGRGHGSEFVVRLPLLGNGAAVVQPVVQRDHPQAVKARHVLVVDDNHDAANSLASLLRRDGHHVDVAHDAETAMRLAEAHAPEAAFLDLGMPGMDGFQLARWFRQSSELSSVTLIAVTGWGQIEDRRRTREAGFDQHFVEADAVRQVLEESERSVTPTPGSD